MSADMHRKSYPKVCCTWKWNQPIEWTGKAYSQCFLNKLFHSCFTQFTHDQSSHCSAFAESMRHHLTKTEKQDNALKRSRSDIDGFFDSPFSLPKAMKKASWILPGCSSFLFYWIIPCPSFPAVSTDPAGHRSLRWSEHIYSAHRSKNRYSSFLLDPCAPPGHARAVPE